MTSAIGAGWATRDATADSITGSPATLFQRQNSKRRQKLDRADREAPERRGGTLAVLAVPVEAEAREDSDAEEDVEEDAEVGGERRLGEPALPALARTLPGGKIAYAFSPGRTKP